jgi:peroxiredoxin Q/BCP
VLGISNDAPEKNKAFQEKFDFPFDLLSDETLQVSMAYGAADSADAGKAGRISYLIGPDGNIRKVYGTVKPAEHPEQVLADL